MICSILCGLSAPPTLHNFRGQIQIKTEDTAKIERLCEEYTKVNFKWTHGII